MLLSKLEPLGSGLVRGDVQWLNGVWRIDGRSRKQGI